MTAPPPTPDYTKTTLILLVIVGVPSLVFIAAGIAGFEPVLEVFRWLALIL